MINNGARGDQRRSQGLMKFISGLKDVVHLNYSIKCFYYFLAQKEALIKTLTIC